MIAEKSPFIQSVVATYNAIQEPVQLKIYA